MKITKEAVRLCIKRKELIDNPEMNERLYLHQKGFTEINNLKKYTQVKALFLESNQLTKISNLDAQRHLKELHLQNNKICEYSS
mmetsp:Transcript_6347/g.14091  ORF Transcript_6347/g.14091 Transcript_6347/m.14091 type:complete len:84 (+) Transcript_6347:131-382(+)